MPSTFGNFFVKAIANSPFSPMLGDSLAVITVEGRKSGQIYSTPINVTKEDGGYTVTSLRSRTWWRNLRGGRQAQLRVAGRQYSVRGEVVENPASVTRGLTAYFQQHPGHARYFGVHLDSKGQPIGEDVERAAGERVIIRLCPDPAQG